MALSRKASRKYESLPVIAGDIDNHTDALMAIKTALEIGQRRTADFPSSFIRVQDLIDLDLIDADGNLNTDIISSGGGSGIVESVVEGAGISVDSTDLANPIVALDLSYSATWSAQHVFTLAGTPSAPTVVIRNSRPFLQFDETDAGTDARLWDFQVSSSTFFLNFRKDDTTGAKDALAFARTAAALTSVTYGNATDNPAHIFSGTGALRRSADNAEIQLGAGNDLRFFHDGTDSWIRNDTGILKLSQGANVALQFNSARAFGVNGANYGASGQVLTSQGSASPPQWATLAGGSGALAYVGEAVVAGAAATDITVSGLNLSVDEEYIIEANLDNATASAISVRLFYNGDTTTGNYDRNIATNGGSANVTNDAAAAQVVASSTTALHARMRLDFDGRPRTFLDGYSGNTTNASHQIGAHMWRTAANVTSFTFSSSVASGFSIGSYVRVWKVLRTGSSPTYGVYATADQSKTSDTTLADDAALIATLAANRKYRLEFDVYWDSSATPDLKFDLNFTGTTTSVFWVVDNRSGPTANLATIATSASPQSFACTALNVVFAFNFSANTTAWEKIVVNIEVGATGGTFSLRWAQNTSNATAVTRRRNSTLLVTEV